MKKIFAIFLTVLLLLSTVSCKGNISPNKASGEVIDTNTLDITKGKSTTIKDALESKLFTEESINEKGIKTIGGLENLVAIYEKLALPEDSRHEVTVIEGEIQYEGANKIEDNAPVEHSSTNNQVGDIDESDTLKTDGEYIYFLSGASTVKIIKTNGESPSDVTVVSEIHTEDDSSFICFYLYKDSLAIIGQTETSHFDGFRYVESNIFCSIYDISNRSEPTRKEKISLGEDTWLVDSRLSSEYLYLAVTKCVFSYSEKDELYDILPSFSVRSDKPSRDETFIVDPCDIYCPITPVDAGYLIIMPIPLASDEEIEPFVMMSVGHNIYMDTDSIYFSSYTYNQEVGTEIFKLSYNDGTVEFDGKGHVPGTMINQYSYDEYENVLRVAYTQWGNDGKSNAVVCFDSNMDIIGELSGIAPEESIMSVRFMDNIAYLVTYETVDPLFIIDLQNPKEPVILGELKLPGFSQYLHPLGGGYLLGIGRETTPIYYIDSEGNEVVTGTKDIGIKLTVFDISRASSPKEKSSYVINGNVYSDVTNPRSIMVDSERGIFAFRIFDYDNGYRVNGKVFSASGVGIQELLNVEGLSSGHDNNSRFCYIGNTLYYVESEQISIFNYSDFSEVVKVEI